MTMNRSDQTSPKWTVPPELSGAVPREVRLTGSGIACTVAAVAMAIGALVSAVAMSVAYVRSGEQRELRQREGVEVQAEVVEVARRGGENPRRIITYRFEADGRSYTGSARLRARDRREVGQLSLIAVGYVRSDPATNWMIGYERDRFPLFVIPIVSLSLLAGAAAIAWNVRRQWRLLSEGRVAQGRVTGHKKVFRDKRRVNRVSYEFEDLNGTTHSARFDSGKTPPPIGTRLPVVYHRDNPRWSAVYPMQFVRTARGFR